MKTSPLLFRLSLALAGSFALAPAIAGPGVWSSAGPAGGQVVDIATSAAAPNVLFVAANAALFKSSDDGLSFLRVAETQRLGFITKVLASPTDADVVYLLSSRIMRSANGGSSFADAVGSGLPANALFIDMVMSPSDSATLYLTTFEHGAFKSINGGASWSAIGAGTLPVNLGKLAIDPTNPLRLVVTPCEPQDGSAYGGAAVYRSVNGGTTFTASTVIGPIPAAFAACASQVAFSPNSAGLVLLQGGLNFSVSAGSYMRSIDGGATFSLDTNAPTQGRLSNFVFVGSSPTQVIAGNTESGSWISNDAGVSYIAGAAPSWPGGEILGASMLSIKPGDTSVRYFGTPGAGFYRSGDSGATWVERNDGLRATNIRSLVLNPTDPATLYAGQSDYVGFTRPFFRSTDAAASWSAAGSGSALDWMRGLLVDANTSAAAATTVIYAVGRDSAPSVPTSMRASPLAKSVNGGTTFTSINNFIGLGAPASTVGALGTSRAIAADTSLISGGVWTRLYLTASGRVTCSAVGAAPTLVVPRLWRSQDAGTSWNTVSLPGAGMTPGNDGLPTGECVNGGTVTDPFPLTNYPIPVPIVVDPTTPTTLYVGTYLSSVGAMTMTPNAFSGVFRSIDGGATWTQRSTGLPRYAGSVNSVHTVLALAMDPSNGSVLYASTNPLQDDGSVAGNVYKTVNAGATWLPVGAGLAGQDIRAIAIDPSNSLRVLVASGGSSLNPGGVYLSEDGGATWDSVSAGLPESSSTSLAIDASNPATPIFYSGTRTGIYSFTRVPDGDGDGAASSTEGAAPNGGDGNGDGMLDAGQANVASPGSTQASSVFYSNGLATPLLARPYTLSAVGIEGACDQLFDVQAVDRDAFGADAVKQKPDGAFRFEIANCTQARVTLRIHGATFDRRSQIRLYGPRVPGSAASIRWGDLPLSIDGDRISFTLIDNGAGDARADGGRILFQGGPAFEEALFTNGFE